LLLRGIRVLATTRRQDPPATPGLETVRFEAHEFPECLEFLPAGARILYSIPPLDPDVNPEIIRILVGRATRLIYLSTTGLYGAVRDVDQTTAPAPVRPEHYARLAAEAAVLSGQCSSLVLRPAAIYGPGRGIHMSMTEGRFRIGGAGENYVSRIHVDDLVTHCEAALFSDLGGAWPVADERPCTTREIATWCSEQLGLPMPQVTESSDLHHTRRADRRVDGNAIRQALGIKLAYPSYREGIVASLAG